MIKPKRRSLDKNDADATAARARVATIIDAVSPEELVKAIKAAPSLRGMILGYVAEHMFEQHVPSRYPVILSNDIRSHDDHDRSVNKSDRTIIYKDRRYGIQLKSIQTNSIAREKSSQLLEACVQNDASDRRTVILDDGSTLDTTCYLRGEYDILAVPLFPFTGRWDYAYKLNSACSPSRYRKYTEYQRSCLLSTTERICWPLSSDWHFNLLELLTSANGSPVDRPDVVTEPSGKIRVRETGAVILPDENEKI